jgi:hypothetical protein
LNKTEIRIGNPSDGKQLISFSAILKTKAKLGFRNVPKKASVRFKVESSLEGRG